MPLVLQERIRSASLSTLDSLTESIFVIETVEEISEMIDKE
ncbi:MAG: hypothetical protein M0P77_03965 [Firmicutes bacterium]|nr:hypothetical protein [Bacillota bacterium]